MSKDKSAKIVQFKPRKMVNVNENIIDAARRPYYAPLVILTHFAARRNNVSDAMIESMVEIKFRVDSIGKLPVERLDDVLRYLIDLRPAGGN